MSWINEKLNEFPKDTKEIVETKDCQEYMKEFEESLKFVLLPKNFNEDGFAFMNIKKGCFLSVVRYCKQNNISTYYLQSISECDCIKLQVEDRKLSIRNTMAFFCEKK